MVLTEEQKTDPYPPASMETAQAATEEALYANVNSTRSDKPTGYPNDTYTDPNTKVARLKAATGSEKVGPSMVLKVMAGDKFNLRVSSWYKTSGVTPGTPVNPLSDLLATLINGVPIASAGKITGTELTSSGVLTPSVTDFLTSRSVITAKPKAYLNWVLVDEQFKLVESSSSAEQVGDNEEFKIHTKSNLPINKNGYLYIYVSNETPNIDVFFDNLQVTHVRGPILEESHYYPFGLTMAGISSKAINEAIENKYKFNGGTELNSTFDVNLYETFFRSYDPQIGRFHQIDPLTESTSNWSAYSFVQNNPLLYLDPLGLDTTINQENHQWNGGALDEVTISGRNKGWVIDASGGWDKNSDPYYQGWEQDQYNWQRGINGNGYEATNGQGSCPNCLNPSTIGNNLLGLTYPGGNNPKSYNGEYNYSYVPTNLSEYPAIGHDRRYDNLKITGASGLFTDTRAIGADWRFVGEELSISGNPFLNPIDRMSAGILGVGLGLSALPKTIFQMITKPMWVGETIMWYSISNQGVNNAPTIHNH